MSALESGEHGIARRCYIRVQGRGVHYLRAGDGPPVVLLHAAMASANAHMSLLQHLSIDHTVFAFDHPGFGDSDPLPGRKVTTRSVADALSATLGTLRIPRCPVYGSHTGGAVALELAHSHPTRVASLVIDGVPAFSRGEARFFRSARYLPRFVVKNDGSHLLAGWVKARDAMTWFPWSERTAKKRLSFSFPSPHQLHEQFLELLRAGESYRAVYSAAFQFDARKVVARLKVPITFMTHAEDLLFAHLDRLPALRSNQFIARYPADCTDYIEEIARVLRGYRVRTKAPREPKFRPTDRKINRRYIGRSGSQLLVRSSAEARVEPPLLLLHEGRASSRVFEPLLHELARHRPVYAPDIPGNGASDALPAEQPLIADYTSSIADTLESLHITKCDIYAAGAGAAVALALAMHSKFRESRLLLEAPDFYKPALAKRLARQWAPPLQPQWDGAHLNRLWLMLRDEYAFWPWFDKSPSAACAVDAPTDWEEMQGRVTDILRSINTYHRLTLAALAFDWRAALGQLAGRSIVFATTADDPRRGHVEAAARSAGLSDVAVLSRSPAIKARQIVQIQDASVFATSS